MLLPQAALIFSKRFPLIVETSQVFVSEDCFCLLFLTVRNTQAAKEKMREEEI